MKKGETRRDQILLTAESLFYLKGYEQTSIQDILDALNFSKGGFYHHFDSKLSLLEAICAMRAEESFEAARDAVDAVQDDPVAALNALLKSSSMFHADNLDYIALLLRVAYREDGALMREKLKQRTLELTLPLMDRVIANGVQADLFAVPHYPLAGELVLKLNAQFSDEVAIILSEKDDEIEQLTDIIAKLDLYRHTIERMLSAPFGSVVMYDIRDLANICRGMAKRKPLE